MPKLPAADVNGETQRGRNRLRASHHGLSALRADV